MEDQNSLFLAKAGAEAIYREDRSFARIKIIETRVEGDILWADIEYLETPGMAGGDCSRWDISLHKEMSSFDENEWHSPYANLAVYFGDDLVQTILQDCAGFADSGSFADFDDIADSLSRYWQKRKQDACLKNKSKSSRYEKQGPVSHLANNSDPSIYKYNIAFSYSEIATMYYEVEDHRRAISNGKRCLELCKERQLMFSDSSSRNVFVAQLRMGDYLRKVDSIKAHKYYFLAYAQNAELRKVKPGSPEFMRDCAILARKIGVLFQDGTKLDRAMRYFRLSLDLTMSLSNQFAEDEQYRLDLDVIRRKIASLNLVIENES